MARGMPADEIREASLFGDVDKLKGVSANIMVGQIPECGTGTIKLSLDEDMLMEELARRGVSETLLDEEVDESTVFAEFKQKTCMPDEGQLTFEDDGLALSMIPDVEVD